ncbi:MAG: Alkaline phosphatase precursor [Pseudomonadota bacterium]|jgi:hypothetical protein
MAASHWYTGESTQTTACVVVRSASTETIDVVANGVTLQASCNTSVNDGNARVDFTGLQPGSSYAYTVGGVAGGTLRTAPADGAYPFWVALSSCWNLPAIDTIAMRLIESPPAGLVGWQWDMLREMTANLRAMFGMGDLAYKNISGTTNGYPLILVTGGTYANAILPDTHRNYWRSQGQAAGIRELMRSVPTYRLKDDHDYDPDNACYSLTWLDASFPATAPHNQSQLDAYWSATSSTWREWALGNPTRTLASDYYKVRLGNVEIFCTDLIHERNYHGDTDGAGKRMISAEQEGQLLADLGNSTAPFKVWVSTKQFISSIGRNSDGWYNTGGATAKGYQTQLQRILSDSRFPRAGCLSVTGDEHVKSDMWVADGRFGGAHAAISQISAGPATIAVITDPDDGLVYRDGVLNKERDTSSAARHGDNNYVLLRVLGDRVERYVLGTRCGLVYRGYVGAADNTVRK